MKRPLLPPLLGFCFGICSFLYCEIPLRISLSLSIFFLVLLFPSRNLHPHLNRPTGIFSSRRREFSIFFLFFFAGNFSAHFNQKSFVQSSNLSSYLNTPKIYLIARVQQRPEGIAPGPFRILLSALAIKRENEVSEVRGNVWLTVQNGEPAVEEGDVVQLVSRFGEVTSFKNFGLPNYQETLKRQGVLVQAWVEQAEFVVKIGEEKNFFLKAKNKILKKLKQELQTVSDTNQREWIEALLLGERKIPDSVEELFRKTGTSHLIVVSGLHMAMVSGFFYALFRIFFSLFPRLLLHVSVKKLSLIFSFIPVLFYAYLVGFSSSVLRSILSFFVLSLLVLLRKNSDALSILVNAALWILVFYPLQLFELSFQLSFLSIFFILAALPRVEFCLSAQSPLPRGEGIQGRVKLKCTRDHPLPGPLPSEGEGRTIVDRSSKKHKIVSLFLSSLVVQIGLLPLLAHAFHQLSWIAPGVNLILVPYYSVILMPLGISWMLFKCLGLPSLFLLKALVFFGRISLQILKLFASFPWASSSVSGFNASQCIAAYVFLLLLIFPPLKHFKKILFFVFLGNLFLWVQPYFTRHYSHQIKIHFLDVGQGDAMLLELPGAKTILLDGGGIVGSKTDVGEHVLFPYLLQNQFPQIDVAVISHPHPDHYLGILSLLKHYPIKELWYNGETALTESFQEILKELALQKIALKKIKEGDIPWNLEGVKMEAFFPPDQLNLLEKSSNTAVNNRSMVLKLTSQNFSMLLPGDIEEESEDFLANRTELFSTILKVPHHGSNSSSSEVFLNRVHPRIALMGVGQNNRFGFPRQVVLERYAARNIELLRTDLEGEIVLEWKSPRLTWQSYSQRSGVLDLASPNPELSSPEVPCRENP
ncbi:MAG: DNA internalization-related competence protein ComEC/Rec2 [Deltaproteobacteria bacterium]|nr:DNA internalization-related competence protein ComEC/Rec2 [Deltaproteobacteria bacterium]